MTDISPEELAEALRAPKRKTEALEAKVEANWGPLELEIGALLSKPCKILSPFLPAHIKADVQIDNHGTCYVLPSILLVHAHQSVSALPPNPAHDNAWVKEFLEGKMKTANLEKGGVPRLVFKHLLGCPESFDLTRTGLKNAILRVKQVGGVLPYSPAMQMRVASSARVVIVDRDRFIADWNSMPESSDDWHSLMIVGVVESDTPKYWLCKQTWSRAPPFVLVPIVGRPDVDKHSGLLVVMTPDPDQLQNAAQICEEPIALNDGRPEPDAFSDFPYSDA